MQVCGVGQMAAHGAHNPEIEGSNPSPASMDSDYITMSQAARLLPSRPSSGTVWRWCRRGVRSATNQLIQLRHVRFGKRLYTRPAWLAEFGERLAQADELPQDVPAKEPTPAPAPLSHAMADAELKEAGL